MSAESTARLIIVMGLPGSGKTYFAKALSEQIGAIHYNSDRIRKELNARPGYSSGEKDLIYKTLFNRVTDRLILGEEIIVDATFSISAYRSPYLVWAEKRGIPVYLIRLEASEQITKERVSRKRPDSDADFAVYKAIKENYEPLKEEHLHLHSDEDWLEDMVQKALDYMSKRSIVA